MTSRTQNYSGDINEFGEPSQRLNGSCSPDPAKKQDTEEQLNIYSGRDTAGDFYDGNFKTNQ